jgi:hypothetical protein
MSESNFGQHGNEGLAGHKVHQRPHPYWKYAHHDWRVWVALLFCLAAIAIYVLSDNLAFLPHPPERPPAGAAAN